MDFLVALIIISPALVFLWIALLRYHARTQVETEPEETQTWMPPTLPKIIEKAPEAKAETVAVPPAPEKVAEAPKEKATKRPTKPKAEKKTAPKIKRTK